MLRLETPAEIRNRFCYPFNKPNDGKWIPAGTDKPCVGCGDCCKQSPCELAGGHNPCLALLYRNGRYWCGLIELNIPGVRQYLLIGYGCGATTIPACFSEQVKINA